MYEDYFGLVEPPFDLSTDPRFLYMSPVHARAKAYLDYAVYKGDGLVVITGEIGVGKSTLIHELATREYPHADVTLIRQPQPELTDFLQALLLEWGSERPSATRAELVAAAHSELTERFMWGRRTTLVIDEAQTLSRELLEALRMLADKQIGAYKPLAVVLVGQPCLREKLSGDDMEQFRQRVRLTFHLSALDIDETRRYIEKRLDVAGASPGPWPIFRDDTIATVHRYTGGVPRLINVLADLALTAAYLDGADSVADEQVRNAIEELGWVPYARRRRQAALAMPGLSKVARLRAASGEALARATGTAGDLLDALRSASQALIRRLPGGLRARMQRMRSAVGSAQMRQQAQGLARLAKATRETLAAVPGRLSARWHDRDWMRANLARAAVVGFIALLTAGVVVSGSQVNVLPAEAAVVETRTAASQPASEDTLVVQPAPAQRQTVPVRTVGAGDAPELTLRPAMYVSAAETTALQPVTAGPETTGEAPRTQPAATGHLPGSRTATPPPTPEPAPSATPSEPLGDGLSDAAWLLEQDAAQYVVQVFAARDRAGVDRFLGRRTGELELAYYRRLRDGQEWHVLVTGPYDSYPTARAASQRFPADVRRAGPWVRSLARVHDDIRAARGELQARALH